MMLSLFIVLPFSMIALTMLSIAFYRSTADMQAQIDQLRSQLTEIESNSLDGTPYGADGQLALDTDSSRGAMVNNSAITSGVSFTVAPALISPSLFDPSNDLMGRPSLAVAAENVFSQPKLAYLTFDDGPTKRTLEILDILDLYNAKATFFVTNQSLEKHPEICLEAFRRGHAIGLHSATHKYDVIYQDVESFLLDIEQNYLKIREITGVAPTVLRFPGGSVNSHNSPIAAELIAAVHERGFEYFDWNSSSGDAMAKSVTPAQLLNNVLTTTHQADPLVILFHDSLGKSSTVKGLASVIESLQADGYAFAALNADSEPVHFKNIPQPQMVEHDQNEASDPEPTLATAVTPATTPAAPTGTTTQTQPAAETTQAPAATSVTAAQLQPSSSN